MLSSANIYTLYFRLYFRLCICLNKLLINQSTKKNLNNKYIIKLNSIHTKIDNLKNKSKNLNSDYNIFPFVNSVINNIFL